VSNYTITPNMNLILPTPGVDPGPDYAQNQNASFVVIDQHTHIPGSGVQITPAGININADLPFNGNNATLLRSVRLVPQGSVPLSGANDIGCIYEAGAGGDLFYNDASGNQIQITKNALVNATSSGISSGTASASFVAGTLVVNAAPLTPANIQVASVLLGNNVASTNFLTLEPPSAMASSFTITLPNVPGVLSSMTLDPSGNMGTITFDQVGVNMTSTGANAIADSRTRAVGSTVGAGGIAISPSCGSFTTSSGSFVSVTNLSVTLTTTGRPVSLALVSDGNATGAGIQSISANGQIQLYNNSFGTIALYNVPQVTIPGCAGIDHNVSGAPGTYTWQCLVRTSGATFICQYLTLVAYEL